MKPVARVEGIIAEQVGAELVVYDQTTHVAHCLSASAAAVFRGADGTRSPEELARSLGLEPAEVAQALAELSACGLLEVPSRAAGGFSRREVAARLAKVGAAAALIYSLDIPPALASASPGCDPGYTNCDNNCTDLQTNVNNCGSCGMQCPSFVTNGTYVCSGGTCAIECNNGYTFCSGTCANLQTDSSYCGNCYTACGNGQTCVAGTCTG